MYGIQREKSLFNFATRQINTHHIKTPDRFCSDAYKTSNLYILNVILDIIVVKNSTINKVRKNPITADCLLI